MLAIRTIVHPTDFSERSDAAFQQACSLARSHGAKLLLLHVGNPPSMVTGGVMMPPVPLPQEFDRPALEAKLRGLRLADENVSVERRVTYGDPAVEILDRAEKADCDLIVMGTHGRSGVGRALLGSVAEQVMRKAPCPVMTVKADGAQRSFRRLLHPTDFSERAMFAFDFACSLAREHGARLTILHVVPAPAVVYGETITELATETGKQDATRTLAQLQPTDLSVQFERQLEEGDPVARIVHAAEVDHCDLVVMGTHGRTGLGRVIMGSVAEQVVRKAPCAVVTLKMPFRGCEHGPEASSQALQTAR